MAWKFFNPNPCNLLVGDCTVRAIALATIQDWHTVHRGLSLLSDEMCDMSSSNRVWGEYLYIRGFRRHIIPDTCPPCYTIRQFCNDHPYGIYILATGTHVVACKDGDYFDTWDSGQEVPIYYWKKEE